MTSVVPVANLPSVSTTPAVNFATTTTGVVDTGGKFATGDNDTGGKFATGVEIIGTLSEIPLHVNLKEKIYLFVNSTTERCPNKIIKTYWIEDFFHLPPVSMTPLVHIELRISQ